MAQAHRPRWLLVGSAGTSSSLQSLKPLFSTQRSGENPAGLTGTLHRAWGAGAFLWVGGERGPPCHTELALGHPGEAGGAMLCPSAASGSQPQSHRRIVEGLPVADEPQRHRGGGTRVRELGRGGAGFCIYHTPMTHLSLGSPACHSWGRSYWGNLRGSGRPD